MSAFVCMLSIISIGSAQVNNIITVDIECDGLTQYSYTSDTDEGGITQIKPEPVNLITLDVLALDVDVNAVPYTFVTNDQFVGRLNGPGIKNDVFFPNIAGVGEHTITYTATNASGCTATKEIIITVTGAGRPIKVNSEIEISLERAQIYIDNPYELDMMVRVFTSNGQLLSEHSADQSLYIDSDPNYNGIYIINVLTDTGVSTRQIFVR